MGRATIRIPSATPGWSLETWQFLPDEGGDRPWPIVVMAHGFAAQKSQALEPFAHAFVQAGLAVLLFDYRTFGGSDGTPRNILNPWREVEDYHSVIAYAREHPETFDGDRIGCWGTSMSGGLSFQVASEDPRLAFGIAECPQVDGVAAAMLIPPVHVLKMTVSGLWSGLRHLIGLTPTYMPAFGAHRSWAFLNQQDAKSGYEQLGGDITDPGNRVQTWVSFILLPFRPTASAPKIKMPFLCCIGSSDTMTPVEAAEACIRKVPRGEVYYYEGGHFAPYPGSPGHEGVLEAQIEFIKRNI